MKESRGMMGMPITVEIADPSATQEAINAVFDYFRSVDETFSTYKETSEISKINRGEVLLENASADMREVFALSEQTKRETDGYFDIKSPKGTYDTSGLVKGWAIRHAARILDEKGFKHFYVDAGGDIEVRGLNAKGEPWRIGIQNPFQPGEIVKVLGLTNRAVATSGTYVRGQHIYNPFRREPITDIVSLTVIGPNIYEADRFATAAFAMGERGIDLIRRQPHLEGYMINKDGMATMTDGFETFVIHDHV